MTGRPVSRAAGAATTVCGQQRSPLPKAPPTKGLTTRTESSGRPKTAAGSVCVPDTLVADVTDWTGGRRHDDMAILALAPVR